MSWEECRPLADAFCAQAGIPSDPAALTARYRSLLAEVAARVDAGYPSNTDLVLEGDRPLPQLSRCQSLPCPAGRPQGFGERLPGAPAESQAGSPR